MFNLSVINEITVMVCTELSTVVHHAFTFKLYSVKFFEAIFKFFDMEVTISVVVVIFYSSPYEVPVICIFVD